MKNGFTLVELLAVIVILAVLALIATPVVLSIIDDAKESAMLRSAEMYLSGVENAVMRENMNSGGNFRPNECTITNGNMTCGSTNVEVEVDGEVPSTGSILFENGKIKEVTLNYTSGTIIKDESGNLVYEGSQSEAVENTLATICTLADGYTENTIGAKYSCDFGAGAKNFYILELGTNPVSNTTLESDEVALILEGNYDTTTQAWCDQDGANPNDNVCAADGLTAKLDEIATAWTELEREQIGLPSALQIIVANDSTKNTVYYIEGIKSWLYNWDNSAWGDTVNNYYTSTPDVDNSDCAWTVSCFGVVLGNLVNNGESFGIRPVVNLKL